MQTLDTTSSHFDGPSAGRARHAPGLGLALLVASALWSLGAGPAAAAGWEESCAYRSPGPMNSEIVTRYYCDRMKTCTDLANARGTAVTENGCFFVQPTGRPTPPRQSRSQ